RKASSSGRGKKSQANGGRGKAKGESRSVKITTADAIPAGTVNTRRVRRLIVPAFRFAAINIPDREAIRLLPSTFSMPLDLSQQRVLEAQQYRNNGPLSGNPSSVAFGTGIVDCHPLTLVQAWPPTSSRQSVSSNMAGARPPRDSSVVNRLRGLTPLAVAVRTENYYAVDALVRRMGASPFLGGWVGGCMGDLEKVKLLRVVEKNCLSLDGVVLGDVLSQKIPRVVGDVVKTPLHVALEFGLCKSLKVLLGAFCRRVKESREVLLARDGGLSLENGVSMTPRGGVAGIIGNNMQGQHRAPTPRKAEMDVVILRPGGGVLSRLNARVSQITSSSLSNDVEDSDSMNMKSDGKEIGKRGRCVETELKGREPFFQRVAVFGGGYWDVRDADGFTPLHVVCASRLQESDMLPIIHTLVFAKMGHLLCRDVNGLTPLAIAVRSSRSPSFISQLLSMEPHTKLVSSAIAAVVRGWLGGVSFRHPGSGSPSSNANTSGKFEEMTVSECASGVPDLMFGRIPLHWAAAFGAVETVKILIRFTPNVDAKDFHGRTPLLVAAANGHRAVMKVLVQEGGSNRGVVDGCGFNAEHLFCGKGKNVAMSGRGFVRG
ncbi:Ankyrin repeat domain-containing protein 52, partial [Blyttiomyces sp. JEL0837]